MPSSGRASPVPNKASTTSDAPSRKADVATSTVPVHCAACARASPRNSSSLPSNARRTGQRRSCRSLAMTKPSPPLLPGPHSICTGCGAQRWTMASPTACPAACINWNPGVPPWMLRWSARAICAGVSTAWCTGSVAEILELQGEVDISFPQDSHGGLKIIPLFTADTQLVAHDLGLYFQLGRLECRDELFGLGLFYALTHDNALAGTTQVFDWCLRIQAAQVNAPRRQASAQNVHHLAQLKCAGCPLIDGEVFQFETGVNPFEIKAIPQFPAGLVDSVGQFVLIDFRYNIERRHREYPVKNRNIVWPGHASMPG